MLSIDEIINLYIFTTFHFSFLILLRFLSINIYLNLSLCWFNVKMG